MKMLRLSSALEKFFTQAATGCILRKAQGVKTPACGPKRAMGPLRSREK